MAGMSTLNVGNNYRPIYPTLMLSLDAGNTASYSGNTSWNDTVGGLSFTLANTPTYNSANGGYLSFSSASAQWAYTNTSLISMSTWSVEVWHYYTGDISGTDANGIGACLVTETYTGTPNYINYSLGNNLGGVSGSNTNITAAFFDNPWESTPATYTLPLNTWSHIVGTYDGAATRLYVNGVLIGSTNYVGSPQSGGHGIRLMRRWDNTDYWGGRLSKIGRAHV